MTPLPPLFSFARRPRRGVSELYASLLMMGITIAMGGVVTGMAMTQYGLAAGAAGTASSVKEQASGAQLSFVTASVSGTGACPARGGPQGTTLAVTVFDYGTTAFAASEIVVNGTAYFGLLPVVQPGGLATYQVALAPSGTCARASGQTVMVADPLGEETQFET
jgi:flagellin-like protein